MDTQIRIIVADREFRDVLAKGSPSSDFTMRLEEPDEGFGETLYPILVNFGLTALPASVAASLIAAWLFDAWQRNGRRDDIVVGVEAGEMSASLALSDDDVKRIAMRLSELLAERQDQSNAGD